jgi:hypothetical protein
MHNGQQARRRAGKALGLSNKGRKRRQASPEAPPEPISVPSSSPGPVLGRAPLEISSDSEEDESDDSRPSSPLLAPWDAASDDELELELDEDALNAGVMGLRPGGAQPLMHDTTFWRDGIEVVQQMYCHKPDDPEARPTDAKGTRFLAPDEPRVPKGIKQVLVERSLYDASLNLKCKKVDDHVENGSCCLQRLLALQPDFLNEKPALQKAVEERGHYCIFLPKYHCELNIIEYFWGIIKRFLRAECDYKFASLQQIMPDAIASVQLATVRRWEARFWRFLEAYDNELSFKDASEEIKALYRKAQTVYSSHRRASERDL